MTLTGLYLTIGEAARYFGTRPETVSDLVKARKLHAHPMRHNNRAKGLDLSALGVIAVALGQAEPTENDIERFLAA